MEFRTLYLGIAGIVGFLFWTIDYFKLFKKPELFFPLSENNKRSGGFLRFCVFLIGIVAWVLISYSLTNPRKPLRYTEGQMSVNDIMIVVDVSHSMLANDFKPNRLEVAKKKIREFIELRPTDQIGIVMFSEKVFTLLPLTTDLKLINDVVEDINVGFLGSGTNIGDALGLAIGRLNESPTKNKIIILLTDGVSNTGNISPIEAAKNAKEFGIKIYSIAIASDKDAKIPVKNGIFGTQMISIPGGSVDIKVMEEISRLTNSKYYIAKDEGALKSVLGEIQKLEKTEIHGGGEAIYEELFFRYLLMGVVLLLFCELIRKVLLREIL